MLKVGDRVMVYDHRDHTKRIGKGTVIESPMYHFNHVLPRYVRVKFDKLEGVKFLEVGVAARLCKRLVPVSATPEGHASSSL